MITVQLAYGDDGFVATISTDETPHPDLLDELTARCKALFLETQASLPDPEPDKPTEV
jgi:hypothetical protein